jgi:uncharacterized protein YndB with AHSA1/START domain
MAKKTNDISDRELKISETLDAPVELVWEAWSRPQHIINWWGPNRFTNSFQKMEFRPGGEWNFTMHGADGTDFKNKSVFREIVPLRKIVYEHLTGPKFIGTAEFTNMGQQTRIDWQLLFRNVEEYVQTVKVFKADEGLKQNILKLADYLAKMKL